MVQVFRLLTQIKLTRFYVKRMELQIECFQIKYLQPMRARFSFDTKRIILQCMRWWHHASYCQRTWDYCITQMPRSNWNGAYLKPKIQQVHFIVTLYSYISSTVFILRRVNFKKNFHCFQGASLSFLFSTKFAHFRPNLFTTNAHIDEKHFSIDFNGRSKWFSD